MEIEDYLKKISVVTIVIIVLAIFIYPDELLTFSYSHLGKLMAILIVILNTCINVIYGTFACALILLYYQSDMIEGMMSYDFTSTITPKPESQVTTKNGEIVSSKKKEEPNRGYEILDIIEEAPDPDFSIPLEDTGLSEDFTYTDKDKFQKKNCKNGQLYEERENEVFFPVKTEFADAIFPNLQFKNENRCNPCDKNCDFAIINQ
jgi:hypothetical protein